ncbi:uncharacterized protein SCODWIG_02213 [Saccharomycodes ludwigii]|uniref:Uncharacterized protein n=1 Tax=Saccharomycodes ludwigii TaxID=36035 RepID=A0A376B728_9ASCO|nr:hypothetical protein SCDLUD_001630 [Saccharomycodes ludwigii]KAH3901847.1 hypothetical protein SCDLUD_001630 [Saccharomycodes ludwigii]SSD60452.1 uncharacterized protein SCODWIG_02213 [Saccharomycodes ludwigii]
MNLSSILGGTSLSQIISLETSTQKRTDDNNNTLANDKTYLNICFKTGISELDNKLMNYSCTEGTTINSIDKVLYNNGIYEIYGPPGIGKSTIGYNIMKNYTKFFAETGATNSTSTNSGTTNDFNMLWIDTIKISPTFPFQSNIRDNNRKNNCVLNMNFDGGKNETKIEDNDDTIPYFDKIRLISISQILMFFMSQNSSKNTENNTKRYNVIIIDGFSKLVNKYLNSLAFKYNVNVASTSNNNANSNNVSLHKLKVDLLQLIFINMLEYCNSTTISKNNTINSGCRIILLDDVKNTTFNFQITMDDINNSINKNEVIGNTNNFLVTGSFSSNYASSITNNSCMLLKSELEANVGMGIFENKWNRFIKLRIGLYYGNNSPCDSNTSNSNERSVYCIIKSSNFHLQNNNNNSSNGGHIVTTTNVTNNNDCIFSFKYPKNYFRDNFMVRESCIQAEEKTVIERDSNSNIGKSPVGTEKLGNNSDMKDDITGKIINESNANTKLSLFIHQQENIEDESLVIEESQI